MDVVISLTVWKFESNWEWSCVDFCHCGYIPARSCTCRHFFCSCQSRFRRLSLYCLTFSSPSKHHNLCNIYLKSESITGQPGFEIRRYNKSSWQISDSYCIKNESVCEGYSRTLFGNNVHEDCSHIKNRLKGFVHVTTMKKEIVVKTVRLHLLHKCHLFPDTVVTSSLSM